MGERSSAEHGFQPASARVAEEQIHQFLLAQGWAGLQFGDHLQRLAAQGVAPERVLWWIPGSAAEVRAVALLHQGLLGLLVPLVDERRAAQAFMQGHLGQLQRIVVVEGQLDVLSLEGFELRRRELAVAYQAKGPSPGLPDARPALPQDAAQIHRIYYEVSWMRQESAEVWRQRLLNERCWVAELDRQVVAAARWTMTFGSWVEIGGVATDPRHRRRGAAAAVTLAATAAALAESRVASLRYGDPALAALYHPLGFQHVGRELVFHRDSRPHPAV